MLAAWLILCAGGVSANPVHASDSVAPTAPSCSAQSALATPYSQAVLASAPLGYWRLGSACAADSSGHGLDGTIVGGVTPATPGTATSFDGSTGYVWLGIPSSLQPPRLSVEAWIKTTGNGNITQIVVSDRLFGYALYLDGATGIPEFSVQNANNVVWTAGGPTSVADGQWHYLVGTYDRTAVRLYVDGAIVSTKAAGAIDYWPVGARIGVEGTFTYEYFHGSISDVAIYDTPLFRTQIARHYNYARMAAATLAVGPNSTVYGQSYTATINVSGTGGTPSGNVVLYDGSSYVGAGTLDPSGMAIINIAPPVGSTTRSAYTPTELGTHNFTAVYGGDSLFAGSTSAPVTHVVTPAQTVTTLTSSTRSQIYGRPVTLTATVSAATPGSGTIAGMLIFMDGSTPLDVESLNSSNTATFSTSSLSTGTHSITAVYDGTPLTGSSAPSPANFANSVSAPLSLTVAKYSASLDVATNSPSIFGQPARILVAVGPPNLGPTGVVTVKDGTAVLGTPAIQNGGASFQTQALAVGIHTITVSYAGDANYAPGSTTFTTTVSKAQTTNTVTSSANLATHGTAVTLTAAVQVVAPGAGAPSGALTFMDGSTALGTVALTANGTASFKTSALTVGPHVLTAVYSGSASFAGSTSTTLSQIVR